MYLVDTSVWIDFLRGTTNSRVRLFEGLLENGEAYLCEVTYAEICFGSKDERQYKQYASYFGALPFLHLPSNWHREIGQMGHVLRRAGYRPYIADLCIAFVALTHHMPVLTSDADFQPYQRLFGLRLE